MKRRLVAGRKLAPGGLVDDEAQRRAKFHHARRVVELGDLVQAEFLVVVGTDPLDRVQRPFFHRRIDLGRRQLLRRRAQFGVDLPQQPGRPHPQAPEVFRPLDLLAEPAAHLGAGVAAGDLHDVVLAVNLAHQLQSTAVGHPGRVLARRHAERHAGIEHQGLLLTEVVEAGGVPALDAAALDRVQNRQRRDDLASGVGADHEFSVGQLTDSLGNRSRVAEHRVQ